MQNNTVIPAVPEDYQYQPGGTAPAGQPVAPQVEYTNNGSINTAPTPPQGTTNFETGLSATGQPIADAGPLITTDALGNFTLMGLVETLIAYAFIMAGALAAVFIFVGGISFILSGGNDEKIKQAINTIRYSIIGLIVTLLSFTFVIIVGRVFGLDFMQYLSFEKVRGDISRLMAPVNNGQQQTFEVQQ